MGKYVEGFKVVDGVNEVGKRNVEGRVMLKFCDKQRAVHSKHVLPQFQKISLLTHNTSFT